MSEFDILLHTHHSFFDGAGIRSVFNEFVSRLAAPTISRSWTWGEEVERLHPASPLLLKPEVRDDGEEKVSDASEVARTVPGANPLAAATSNGGSLEVSALISYRIKRLLRLGRK